ncbi:MAG: NAD+ synthase [Dichotomicrobium sp.]
MTDQIKIALAQLDPTVGDLAGNIARARSARAEAAESGADLVCFPELFVTGYPPEDLILKPAFVRAAQRAVEELAADTADGGPAVLIGTPWPGEDKPHNAVALLEAGEVRDVRHKVELPNYGVFDEKRIFDPGEMPGPMNFRGVRIGVPICEDIWIEDVCECLAETGAELLIVPNGSPFSLGKRETRQNVAVARVAETGLPMAYLNQVGGQDELVFDGASFVLNAGGGLAVQMLDWREQVAITEWRREATGWTCAPGERAILSEGDAAAYQACVLGLRDYVTKNGFPGVVLGLSGGIDSALSAAIAVDALGADRVHCIMLPYKYTSEISRSDAAGCAEALGVRYDTVPIEAPVEGFIAALDPLLDGGGHGVTVENLQSRARGTILMAVSNESGAMLVTTGNKSEMSVGYATLYGDMNGGFNPIKDLYKTQVYALARWRNANPPIGGLGPAGEVIPENIITKAPSAELKPDQTDQDKLPPYDVLDDILRCLIEHEMPHAEIVARGHGENVVREVEHMLYVAEYKRRQSAPGVKITERVFGRDWRYPITNKFREGRS